MNRFFIATVVFGRIVAAPPNDAAVVSPCGAGGAVVAFFFLDDVSGRSAAVTDAAGTVDVDGAIKGAVGGGGGTLERTVASIVGASGVNVKVLTAEAEAAVGGGGGTLERAVASIFGVSGVNVKVSAPGAPLAVGITLRRGALPLLALTRFRVTQVPGILRVRGADGAGQLSSQNLIGHSGSGASVPAGCTSVTDVTGGVISAGATWTVVFSRGDVEDLTPPAPGLTAVATLRAVPRVVACGVSRIAVAGAALAFTT
jgi:hypothetical protein